MEKYKSLIAEKNDKNFKKKISKTKLTEIEK